MIVKNPSKYAYMFKIGLNNATNYVYDYIGSQLFILIILYIFIELWSIPFGNQNIINGFTYSSTIWYLLMTESIWISNYHINETITKDVRSGDIVYKLNKPYSVVLYYFTEYISNTLLSFVSVFVLGSIFISFFVGFLDFNYFHVLLTFISIGLALILGFLFLAIIGLIAFFLEQTEAFRWLYAKIVFILGGMMIPIDFFPQWLKTISAYLPFAFVTYYPAKLFVSFNYNLFWKTLIAQLSYIILLSILVSVIYYYCKKRVEVNGG